MKPLKLLVLVLALTAPHAASAKEASGSGALALAALVARVSPLVAPPGKAALKKFLNGQADFKFPKGRKITVTAGKVACRSSNVDITAHGCDLSFGTKDVKLKGRAAHELYATLLEAGVEPNPGAGNVWVTAAKLKCVIDVDEVKAKAGGGATCHYAASN